MKRGMRGRRIATDEGLKREGIADLISHNRGTLLPAWIISLSYARGGGGVLAVFNFLIHL